MERLVLSITSSSLTNNINSTENVLEHHPAVAVVSVSTPSASVRAMEAQHVSGLFPMCQSVWSPAIPPLPLPWPTPLVSFPSYSTARLSLSVPLVRPFTILI